MKKDDKDPCGNPCGNCGKTHTEGDLEKQLLDGLHELAAMAGPSVLGFAFRAIAGKAMLRFMPATNLKTGEQQIGVFLDLGEIGGKRILNPIGWGFDPNEDAEKQIGPPKDDSLPEGVIMGREAPGVQ